MKASVFTTRLPDGEYDVWFNSVSGTTLRMPKRQSVYLDGLLEHLESGGDSPDDSIIADLLRLGILVGAGEDEFGREHRKYLEACSGERLLLLTVAPTLACNLRCSYCFQQEMTRSRTMAPELVESLLEFIEAKSRTCDEVVVQWYGGEPLLAADLIQECTERILGIAAENEFEYRAEMLTNGLLLQRGDLWRRLGEMRVSAIQIPLDGLPATYARRKEISEERATEFYDFLLENIEAIAELTGSVVLRINVDRENIREAHDVVELFARAGVRDQRLDFRLGYLNTSRGIIDCIPHDCFSAFDFQEAEESFQARLRSLGFSVFGKPAARGWPCAAPLKNHFSIDPQGRMGKCVPAIGTTQAVFAALHPGDLVRTLAEIESEDRPYGDFDPFEDDLCGGCPVLPVCLGSCPKRVDDGAARCVTREGLERRIVSFATT